MSKADIFIRSGTAGAPNLRGEVIAMEQLRLPLEKLRRDAADLFSVRGTEVPAAYRMSGYVLVRAVGEIPRMPFCGAIMETIEKFESLG